MERSRGGSPDEFTVSIPSDLLLTEPRPQESSIESSVVATDCEDEKPPDPVVSRVEDPRYVCVIAIGSADIFGSTAGSKSPGSGLKKRGSTGSPCPEDAVEEVVCQCVAVDFLPTPAKLSRTPVIFKKLNFTATNVSTSQEIFSTGGECVICLERPLATIQLPCRFFCVCYECLEEIDQCPHLPSQVHHLRLPPRPIPSSTT
ncbi:hypothetical protein PRIC2_014351 [Phytophthora ramorum]